MRPTDRDGAEGRQQRYEPAIRVEQSLLTLGRRRGDMRWRCLHILILYMRKAESAT